MKRRSAQPEQVVKKAILKYLAMFPAKLLAVEHKNQGTMRKGTWMPSSTTILGVSDLIIFPKMDYWDGENQTHYSLPFFAEIKTDKGKQSIYQLGFQQMVEGFGYSYYIWRSIEDAEATLKKRGLI